MLSRRKFLTASSAAAMVAATPALAALHGSRLSGAPTGVATINGFGSSDYPFKNFMKGLTSIQASGGAYAFPAILDANGYPAATPATTFFGAVFLPNSYTGNWTLYGTGECDLFLQTGVTPTIVSNPNGYASIVGTLIRLTATANTSWSVTFNLTGTSGTQTQVQVQFLGASGAFSGFTSLVLCRASAPYTGDKAAIDSGILTQCFNSDFINDLGTLNPATLRVIQWNNPDNQQNITKFARRMPVGALTYSNARWDPSCIATNGASGMKTSNTGDAYSITTYPNDTGSWVDGETIQVQWSAANTTTAPTFVVGSRAAKTVQTLFASAVSAGTLANNGLGTLIYDAVLDVVLYNADGINGNGVPYEVTAALANVLNKNLRETIPTHFDLASVNSWTALFRDNLNSNLSLHAPYSNEVWNFGFGFEQTSWAQAYGAALGFPNNNNRQFYSAYSLRICQFMPAVASAWVANGRSRSTLKCILEFQAFGPSGTGGATNVYRLQSADLAPSGTHTGVGNATYVSVTGGADFTQFPNRAADVVDYLSYATYYSGAQCSNADGNYSNGSGTGLTTGGPSGWTTGLLGAADAFAAGGATNISNSNAFFDWDISQGTNNGVIWSQCTSQLAANIYPVWETVAASYDAQRASGFSKLGIACYEGGLECIAPSTARCTALGISTAYGGPGGKIDNALTGYKTSALFTARVQQQFTDFMGTSPGRGSNHSVAPAWYQFTGANQWAMEIADLYGGFFQSYNGFAAFH